MSELSAGEAHLALNATTSSPQHNVDPHLHGSLPLTQPHTSAPVGNSAKNQHVWAEKSCAKNHTSTTTQLHHNQETHKGGYPPEWLNDPEMPFNWKSSTKWTVASWLFALTVAVNMNGAGFASVATTAAKDLGTSRQIMLVGNALYFIAQGIAPLILAPLSESRGRVTIYTVSGALFAIFYLPQGLARNPETWIVSRFIQGCAGSVVEANIGGSLADMFPPSKRGMILSVYIAINYVGTGIGPVIAAATLPQSWRWQPWLNMIIAGAVSLGLIVFGKETRASTLFAKRKIKKQKEAEKLKSSMQQSVHANDNCAPHEDEHGGQSTAASSTLAAGDPEPNKPWYYETAASLARPTLYLFCEPIVTFFSLWIGFTFGCIYLVVESAAIVYGSAPNTETPGFPASFNYGYGFSGVASGAVLLTYLAGAFIGFLTSLHQEHLYQKATKRHFGGPVPPEARLYWSAFAGIIFSVACFWYAWSARTAVHPAASIIGLSFVVAGVYPIHFASFAYLSDTYEEYASSALASQTLIRTITAGVFPLFTDGMYRNLTPPVASSVLGAVALLLGVFPFILLKWGPAIRRISKRTVDFEEHFT